MAINPIRSNIWLKTEKHNACRAQNMYARGLEMAMSMYGATIAYYPVSEYSLDSLTSLWGEDPNKKYLEKYTLKVLSDGTENDNFTFNQFGIDKSNAERVIYVSKKMFREVTGKVDPLTSDNFLWYQNKIIYEVIDITDDENILLGEEMTWKLVAMPRIISGEIYGSQCDSTRPDAIDPECDTESSAENEDGSIVDNPDIVIPGPTPKSGDESKIEDLADSVIIRSEWGNWN